MSSNRSSLLAVLICLAAAPSGAATGCLLSGQAVVETNLSEDGLTLGLCRPSPMGGLSAWGFEKQDLVELLDYVEKDKTALEALQALKIGATIEEMRQNVQGIEESALINGFFEDKKRMEYLADKFNAMRGLTGQLAEARRQDAANSAVGPDEKLTAGVLAGMIAANAPVIQSITSGGCRSEKSDRYRSLTCVRLTFDDKTRQPYCPFKAEDLGPDRKRVHALGDKQHGRSIRTISFENGRAFYADRDGKKFEIVKINRISGAAGLGPLPFNWLSEIDCYVEQAAR